MSVPRIDTPEYYARLQELEARSWWGAAMRDVLAQLLARAVLPARGTLLDVGCAAGGTMRWFTAAHPAWTAVGVDVAADGLAYAARGGATVSRGDAQALPVASRSVDLAVALDVLNHLPLGGGDALALRELHRVLRPSGYLVVRAGAQMFPRTRPDPEVPYQRYDAAALRALLREAGFGVVRFGHVNALLGVAEIPRELRSRRRGDRGAAHGILAPAPREPTWVDAVKRVWVRAEGRLLDAGVAAPFGRSLVALCRPGSDA